MVDDGITVYAATDRGYTAAEKMHNVFDAPPGSLPNDDQELGGLINNQVCGKRNKRWLPIDKLFELVNPHTVRRELSRKLSPPPSQADMDRYTDYFCSHVTKYDPITNKQFKLARRCIFAALALAERLEDAPFFANHLDLWDGDLPLERHDQQLVSRVDPAKTMDLPEGWNYRVAESFEYYQLYMLSPFFDLESQNDVPFHELDESCVLPFIEDFYSERRQYGHHGTVWKVRLHPAHHNFTSEDGENPYFAIKKLTSNDSEGVDFKKEVRAWAKSVGVAGHPHIIRLLATWHQNHSWYLLFGWADGNLRDYWKENPQGNQYAESRRCREQAQWVGEQCMGIAQGLAKIHRASSNDDDESIDNFGIHGDVKPENILRFADNSAEYGRLVICDFGFTRFHSRLSRSAASPEGASLTYRAPEYDTIHKKKRSGISRACDIWALGCVYLEFMIWYLKGSREVEESFPRHRIDEDSGDLVPCDKFFLVVTVDGQDSFGAIVKPCVGKVSGENLTAN